MTTKVYISEHCGGCQEIKSALTKGNKGSLPPDTEIVSIDTKEGFDEFVKEVLDHGDGEVPSVYKDGKKCELQYHQDGSIKLNCPKTTPPLEPK